MKPLVTLLSVSIAVLALASCTCKAPHKLKPIQQTDKKLTCKDVLMEINEAEFRKKEALDASAVSGGQVLLPLCWLPSYFSARNAVEAADDRLEYLTQIHDVLGCGKVAPDRPLPPPPAIRNQLPDMRGRGNSGSRPGFSGWSPIPAPVLPSRDGDNQ